MKEIFGVEISYILNSRVVWKHCMIALVIFYFLLSPIVEVAVDY